jgi:hypothetical protein
METQTVDTRYSFTRTETEQNIFVINLTRDSDSFVIFSLELKLLNMGFIYANCEYKLTHNAQIGVGQSEGVVKLPSGHYYELVDNVHGGMSSFFWLMSMLEDPEEEMITIATVSEYMRLPVFYDTVSEYGDYINEEHA